MKIEFVLHCISFIIPLLISNLARQHGDYQEAYYWLALTAIAVFAG